MSFEMSDPVTAPIQLEAISKCYRIFQNPQDRFKQALLDRFHGVLGKKTANQYYREHWALRDVSFELQPGEAVGILGRNGAGKSTLLQIIAGTLEPTSGSVKTSGRITALLELGSGFNPEFTGRENVFLNAQILGMSREDVLARFDDIASFADIGDFIDQPVKTYSSGMMMRLAFAVQTAVSPKVLIVDEALSVGDMFFQAKCMARIRKLVDDGVTLLFVSHDVGAVRQLCGRALLLAEGNITAIGKTRIVADEYVRAQLEDRNRVAIEKHQRSPSTPENNSTKPYSVDAQNNNEPRSSDSHLIRSGETKIELRDCRDLMFGSEFFSQRVLEGRSGTHWALIKNVQMLLDERHSIEFDFDDEVEIRVLVSFKQRLSGVNVAVKVRTLQGSDIVFLDTRLQGKFDVEYLADETYLYKWKVRLPLMHGNYSLAVGVAKPPEMPGDDWIFVDMVQHAFDFKMAARAGGMIGGFVALPAQLDVVCLPRGLEF